MKRIDRGKEWWVFVWVVIAAVCGRALADEIDCDKYQTASERLNLEKAQIIRIQKVLEDKGYEHGADDGILGPQTMAALNQYCADATNAVIYQLSKKDLNAFQRKNEIFSTLQSLAPNTDEQALTEKINLAIKDLPDQDNPAKYAIDAIIPAGPSTENTSDPSEVNFTYIVNPIFVKQLELRLIPENVIALLEPLQGIQYATITLFDNAVEEKLKVQHSAAKHYHGRIKMLIRQAAQEKHPIDEPRAIEWKSANCGCVQDFTGVAYGLYPYWMIGDAAPAIDFSALTRIAYFAVFLDTNGGLKEHSLWKIDRHKAEFIKKANRYRTKVDLVIHNPQWQTWYKTVNTHKQMMVEAVTHLVSTMPMCDGVTLYFKKYPASDRYSLALQSFLQTLHEAMNNTGAEPYLNLMLPEITEKNEKTVQTFLKTIFSDQQPGKSSLLERINLLIIFIEEPTTDKKKKMRYIIEKSFKGQHRKAVLRKIVPILSPPANIEDIEKNQQFEDDLIYFEDNFGGVGFFPIPTGDENTLTWISEQINKAFLHTENQDFFQQFVYGRTQWLCNFICPHRIPARWVLAVVAIFLVGWTTGSLWICELRGWFKKLFWCFMGLILFMALLLMALMTCDPDLIHRSTEIFITLMIVLIAYTIYRQIRKMKQAEYP
jgi:hypothetical protein